MAAPSSSNTTALVVGAYPLKALFHTLLWPDKDDVDAWRCFKCLKPGASMMCGCCQQRVCSACFPSVVPTMQELATEIGEDPTLVGFHQPLMVLVLCFACTREAFRSGHAKTRMFNPFKPDEFVPIVRMGPCLAAPPRAPLDPPVLARS
jgi:hypothetical protein